jgi:ribosomal protein S18 acetylase RimI-like enzyme
LIFPKCLKKARVACPGPLLAKIWLRPVTSEDHAFLFLLYAAPHAGEGMWSGWNEAQWQPLLHIQFQAQFAVRTNPSFDLVCVDNTPIGKLFVEHRQDGIHMIDMALLPDYQQRGIGSYLITHQLKQAAVSGVPVTLRVQKTSRARHLYGRLGFEVAEDEGGPG